MHGTIEIIFFIVISQRLDLTSSLVELSPFGDNVIVSDATLIQDSFNKLLKLFYKAPEEAPKLERPLSIHNNLLSITLQESDFLKNIFQETRLPDLKNGNLDLTNTINQALNDNNNDSKETFKDDVEVIKKLIDELKYLKAWKNPDKIQSQNVSNNLFNSVSSDNNFTDEYPDDKIESFENFTNPYWTQQDELAVTGGSNRRIYRGKRTKIKYFPFVAAVLLFQMFYCAGSIISSDLIITAASCLQLAWNNRLFRENPAFLSVRVGSSFHSGGGETIPVQEIYFHPTYDPKSLQGNLCVLRISRHLKFSGKKKQRIKKIMYDTNEHKLPMETPGITIVGWGAVEAGNVVKFADPINYAVLDVYPLDDCQDVYSKQYVKKYNFCAGFISMGGGACNHDVGDPGIIDGILVGVVSFGAPICGTPDAPTVFTKIGYYADWIEEIIEMRVPTIHVRTTTREPWTAPSKPELETTTFINLFAETKYPDSVVDMLRSYFNHDDHLYNAFLRTLQKKDIGQFIKALRGGDELVTSTTKFMYSTTEENYEIIKKKEKPPASVGSDSVEEIGPTKSEVFIDSFETITKKHHKKRKHHRNRHIKHKKKPVVLSDDEIYITPIDVEYSLELTETSNKKILTKKFYPYITPKKKMHKDHSVKVSKFNESTSKHTLHYYFTYETSTVTQPTYETTEPQTTTTELIKTEKALFLDLLKEEPSQVPSTTKENHPYRPHVPMTHFKKISNSVFNYFKKNIAKTKQHINDNREALGEQAKADTNLNADSKKNNEDRAQAAEEFFTHSILDYLAHRQVNPLKNLKPDSYSNSNEFADANQNKNGKLSIESNSNEVTGKKRKIPKQIYNDLPKWRASDDEDDYLSYLKTQEPKEFYKLLQAAINEIEKTLERNDLLVIKE